MNQVAPIKFGMGASVRRIEDLSLITGRGRFTADVMPAGALTGYVVRSIAAHARFTVGGIDSARSAPGVHLVWTAADVADIGMLPCVMKGPKPEAVMEPPHPVLCREIVRHVGDPMAFVVADDLEAAVAAAELLEIDYEMLPAIINTVAAAEEGSVLVWPERGTNVAFVHEVGDAEAANAAFAAADQVAELDIVNNRVVANYMEPRAVVAEYDRDARSWTLTLGSQGSHRIRNNLAGMLGVERDRVRVITPDVGGGFGTKSFMYAEYPLAAKAAERLERPVRWISDRSEHFVADAHGRDHITQASFAMTREGRITAMRIATIANMGAYLHEFGPHIPWGALSMSTGVYDIPVLHATSHGVFTNTVPTDAYRGAGRPEASYIVERLMDEAARVAGLSPEEIRRRNFIRPEQMPYRTQTGRVYDSGEFAGHLERALAESAHAGFAERLEQSRERGRIRGIGISTYIEACAFPGSETAKAVLEPDGSITIHAGTQTNGQGHHTAYAQFAAEPLGVTIEQIRVKQGDTADLPTGGGTGGSRSIPIGVPAVLKASEMLAAQIKDLASEELEASAADIVLEAGEARIAGTDRAISLAAIAAGARDKTKLSALNTYSITRPSFPNGSHVCEVEIDPETGMTEVVRYVVVDDFGVVVNPLLLAGQIHGGVAQGIGQALLEHTVYDSEGQLITATFNDYALPRAWDFPFFEFQTRNVPTEANLLGIKGAGEAGTVGSAQAVMNAVADALDRAYGIRSIDMPVTPERLWRTIRLAV